MKTILSVHRSASIKRTSKSSVATAKSHHSGLYGLYRGKMVLNGTSNEVFNLGL